jgi:DNA-binding NarL/FixJ family response regulator
MKLLIVEDNEQMRRTIRSFMVDIADVVFECTDGADALAAYELRRPDWVLMDIEMKRMDGISATRQIMSSFPCARVMIVTDYDDPDLREAAHRAGACEYVVKENLLELRRILLDKSGRSHH